MKILLLALAFAVALAHAASAVAVGRLVSLGVYDRTSQREDSAITYVDFEHASSTPDEVITLYYDTWEHLLARGVVPMRRPATPQPSPDHFAPDP